MTLNLLKAIICFWALGSSSVWALFLEAQTAKETVAFIEQFQAKEPQAKNSVLFFDIDQTLLRFHSENPWIDEMIAKIKSTQPHPEEIVSIWRKNRKTYLSDSEWPQVICDLKKIFPVYALTAIEAGPYGILPSVEQWRFNHLEELGVTFSDSNSSDQSSIPLKDKTAFYRGIIFSGNHSKADILEQFLILKKLTNRPIIVVDDKMKNLEVIAQLSDRLGFAFLGIWYTGVKSEKISGHVDLVIDMQFKSLIHDRIWIESDEAYEKVCSMFRELSRLTVEH
jgi:predicted MPP superfamily phosphohydrolase